MRNGVFEIGTGNQMLQVKGWIQILDSFLQNLVFDYL